MTHDELLAKLEHDGLEHWDYSIPTSHRAVEALRAVVELHKPIKVTDKNLRGDIETNQYCKQCEYIQNKHYPCLTIQSIEKELA